MNSWSKRKLLFPDYKSLDKEVDEIQNDFSRIKGLALNTYNFGDLSDSEIESYLFKLYEAHKKNFCNDIDKVILLDYINNFFTKVYPLLFFVIEGVRNKDSLEENQELLSLSLSASRKNGNITKHCFDKYFCVLTDGCLKNKLDGTVSKNFLPLLNDVKSKGEDMFKVLDENHSDIATNGSNLKHNYDKNYWYEYANELADKKGEILLYFEKSNKKEALDDFIQIADIYYLYTSYYKMISSSSINKN